MPDGEKAYTRSGEFRLRPDRTLVTAAGLEVLSTNGDPFVLLPGGGAIVVNQDGTVFQGNISLGKISIQRFENTAALIPSSGGMFKAGPGAGMEQVD
jgi:flagellar basal-body rod protein FlgF